MGQRTPRTRAELLRALEIQRQAIDASAKSYDDGNRWEALRLATAVYNLVHDHRSIQSLFGQIGIRRKLRYFAGYQPYNPRNLMRETPLVMLRLHSGGMAEYVPNLDNGPPLASRRLEFQEWWEEDVILADGPQFKLTRKRLVFVLRNQEGGGHYSAEMNDQTYMRFAQAQVSTPFMLSQGVPPIPILGAETASMRQIAWEIVKTLDDYGPIQ